jgi:uncharacterized membrane protein
VPDRSLPWLWAAVLFLVLWGLALLRHHTLLGSYDLGYFDQAAWLISHGRTPFVTVRAIHLLGDHGSFAFYPMGRAAGSLGGASIPGLLAIQAAALSVAVVPLYWIGRRLAGLSIGVCSALLAAYSLYPAVSNVNLFDFHPEVLVVPALLGAAYFSLKEQPRWPAYAACVAVTLACREDAAVPVFFLGVLLAFEGKRRRWAGALTILAAVVWLALDLTVVLPDFAGGSYVQDNRFAQYGDSLGSAAGYMLTHPFIVAGDFATKPNLYVLAGLFAPLLFLPLLAPRYLLPGLPLQLAYLLTNVAAAHTITAQYTVTTIPFVFLAAAMALGRGRARWRERPWHRVMVVAAVAGFLWFASASPRNQPWEWARRDRVDQARLAAARVVPGGAAVAATIRMWPLLAERPDLYHFPMPLEGWATQSRDPVPLSRRISGLHWIVLDTADRKQWTAVEAAARARLGPYGFVPVFDRAGIVVYHRP